MKIATLGAGCFWCVEAIFESVLGIIDVSSGYSGGTTQNPTYNDVCSGKTGHAEVVQLTYDPSIISFTEILNIFWQTHDPTTLNRQGADIGTQYRSIILYHDKIQKKIAQDIMLKIDQGDFFKSKVVTEISPFQKLYKAEEIHQNYFKKNPNVPYCQFVIKPKLDKFLSRQ
tara:strand:+ start:19 stop:531 length:513 start_codon:yes stop_codon:yes gene_type:complete